MNAVAARSFVPAVPMRSPLSGVTPVAWEKFVRVLAVQPIGAVSASNAIGMFAHRPRRLVDIGVMRKPRYFRAPSGRLICGAEFVPPMTDLVFLKSPLAQYDALVRSMTDYAAEYEVPDGLSLSGMLAILHRGGPPGLRGKKMFDETRSLFDRAKDLF